MQAAVGGAPGRRIAGPQPLLEVERQPSGRRLGLCREPRHHGARRRQHDPGAGAIALAQRQDRPGAAARRQGQAQVDALGQRQVEAAARDRHHQLAVDRDQARRQRAAIDHEVGPRAAIDQAQPDPAAGLDTDDLGIGQRALVGEIGVVVDVVEVHLHPGHRARAAHLHAGHRAGPARATGGGGGCGSGRPSAQPGEDLRRILEAEIAEQHDHRVLVEAGLGGVGDDQRRGQQALLLQPLVRMHPVGARMAEGEIIGIAPPRRQRRLADPRHAVLLVGRQQAMPVDERVLRQPVLELDPEAPVGGDRQARRPVGLADTEHRRGLAVDLDDMGFDAQLDGVIGRRRPESGSGAGEARGAGAGGEADEATARQRQHG